MSWGASPTPKWNRPLPLQEPLHLPISTRAPSRVSTCPSHIPCRSGRTQHLTPRQVPQPLARGARTQANAATPKPLGGTPPRRLSADYRLQNAIDVAGCQYVRMPAELVSFPHAMTPNV